MPHHDSESHCFEPPAMLWSKADNPKKVERDDIVSVIDRNISSIPRHTLLLAAFGFGVVSTLGTKFVYARFFKRIKNSDWVYPDSYKKRRWIKGRVVRYVTRV